MFTLLSEIIDHEENKEQTLGVTRGFTTKGWRFLVGWKDGSTSYVLLREVKNTCPTETANYAVASGLEKEPAFSWWVKHTLKKKKHFIKVVKSQYSQRSHKFGILVPKTVEEALDIDRRMNMTLWRDAIKK